MESIQENLLAHANMQKINAKSDPLKLSNLLNLKKNNAILDVLKYLDNGNNWYLVLQLMNSIHRHDNYLSSIYAQYIMNEKVLDIIYQAISPDTSE